MACSASEEIPKRSYGADSQQLRDANNSDNCIGNAIQTPTTSHEPSRQSPCYDDHSNNDNSIDFETKFAVPLFVTFFLLLTPRRLLVVEAALPLFFSQERTQKR
ncbi:hypothetical protein GJ744_009872 [Endocarpon pusillum]|uniref:Uncharacterized protein n=1 Tax=Endocarpon pusillum TaxID=364733 RepID=A0A8H7AF71_9EURO|nr:hypothetical protein GJ744_009872 [Endocarpon pusillum]